MQCSIYRTRSFFNDQSCDNSWVWAIGIVRDPERMKDIVLYLNKNAAPGDDSEVFDEPPEDGWYSRRDISTNIPPKLKVM